MWIKCKHLGIAKKWSVSIAGIQILISCFPLNPALRTSICGQSQITFVKPLLLPRSSAFWNHRIFFISAVYGARISFPHRLYSSPFDAPFYMQVPPSKFSPWSASHGSPLRADGVCCLTWIWGWGVHKNCIMKKVVGIKVFVDTKNSKWMEGPSKRKLAFQSEGYWAVGERQEQDEELGFMFTTEGTSAESWRVTWPTCRFTKIILAVS